MNVAPDSAKHVEQTFVISLAEREKNKLASALEVLKSIYDPVPDCISHPDKLTVLSGGNIFHASICTTHLAWAIKAIQNLLDGVEVKGTFTYEEATK